MGGEQFRTLGRFFFLASFLLLLLAGQGPRKKILCPRRPTPGSFSRNFHPISRRSHRGRSMRASERAHGLARALEGAGTGQRIDRRPDRSDWSSSFAVVSSSSLGPRRFAFFFASAAALSPVTNLSLCFLSLLPSSLFFLLLSSPFFSLFPFPTLSSSLPFLLNDISSLLSNHDPPPPLSTSKKIK